MLINKREIDLIKINCIIIEMPKVFERSVLWIPINEYKDPKECVPDGYVIQRTIGKGSSGDVLGVCKDSNCDLVLKVSRLNKQQDYDIYERDVFFSKMLSGSGISPKYVEAWVCAGRGYMVSERWDGDILSYIKHNQWEMPSWMYEAIINVINKLTDMGICHGDLKFDNMLYSEQRKAVVINDFGYSFDYKNYFPLKTTGWLGFRSGCIPPDSYNPKFNLWNMHRYLERVSKSLKIVSSDGTSSPYRGVQGLSLTDVMILNSTCEGTDKTDAKVVSEKTKKRQNDTADTSTTKRRNLLPNRDTKRPKQSLYNEESEAISPTMLLPNN
jgi:serine/threonine protein kinase